MLIFPLIAIYFFYWVKCVLVCLDYNVRKGVYIEEKFMQLF